MSSARRELFAGAGDMQRQVSTLFANLPSNPDRSTLELRFRDPVRRILHYRRPQDFPAGRSMASLDRVVRAVLDADPPLCYTQLTCQSCSLASPPSNTFSLPSLVNITTHDAYHRARRTVPRTHAGPVPRSMNLSEWLSAAAFTPFHPIRSFDPHCPHCDAHTPHHPTITALTTPQLLAFDIADFAVYPELYFTLQGHDGLPYITYRLSAILYFGAGHFTCRYIDSLGCCWGHDGLHHNGMMKSEGPAASVDLTLFNSRRPSILYFALV